MQINCSFGNTFQKYIKNAVIVQFFPATLYVIFYMKSSAEGRRLVVPGSGTQLFVQSPIQRMEEVDGGGSANGRVRLVSLWTHPSLKVLL